MTIFLETQRLFIKTSSLTDLSDWLNLYAELPSMNESKGTVEEWLKQDIAHFEKHGFSMSSVFEKSSGKFIGRGGLVYLDYNDTQPDIELGYILRPLYWEKGYATELGKALLAWGFSHLGVNKLVAVTRPENKKSQHVLEKVGMHYVKVMSFRGEDFLFYEILNPHQR